MSKKSFIALSLTWGIVLSSVGGIVYALLRLLGKVPKKHGPATYFEIGSGWGGVNLGPIFVVNANSSERILDHELGHGYQNCMLGPFFLIICIWSFARYHYRNVLKKLAPNKQLPPYDSIWFEGWATRLGGSTFGRDTP